MTDKSHLNGSNVGYIFDGAWQHERERLASLENTWDAKTLRHLKALGLTDGWHCLEVGAGGGSIAKMLCSYVGPIGKVVATDLDTRFLDLKEANLTVLQHDIVHDDLPENVFDLVHSRIVLEHLPQSELALDRMIAALKPGGRLLIEDFDHVTLLPDPNATAVDEATWQCYMTAFVQYTKQNGLNIFYGRRLHGLLSSRGLVDVDAEGNVTVVRGGSVRGTFMQLSATKLRTQLIETGAIDAVTMDRMLAMLNDPNFTWISPLVVSAWGTKP